MQSDAYKYIFSEVLKMSGDGFIVVDRNNIVVDINERYAAFLGHPRDQVIGHPITDVIPNSKMLDIMEKGYSEELALHKYVPGYVRDSDNDFVLVSRSCVRNAENAVVAGVAQVHFRSQALEVAKRMMREYSNLEFYKEQYESTANHQYSFHSIIGHSRPFQENIQKGIQAAHTDFPVLLTGETGTGKEVFAHAIHNASKRSGHPMVCLNCAAIPADLLESELFGYEDGAFTGAKKGGKRGKFQLADGGTIFLDEIGDMPLVMQAKLLRVLQEKEIDPVGGRGPVPVDVRVISATRRDLPKMIRSGEFREDLYYRLNVINVELIPLRDRREDIPDLAQYFLSKLNSEYQRSVCFQPAVLECFSSYSWPGNLRELDNVIKGAYATCDSISIELADLPCKFQSIEHAVPIGCQHPSAALALSQKDELCCPIPIKERLERIEYSMILEAYQRFSSVRKAAAYLQMSMATYVRKKNLYAQKYGEG